MNIKTTYIIMLLAVCLGAMLLAGSSPSTKAKSMPDQDSPVDSAVLNEEVEASDSKLTSTDNPEPEKEQAAKDDARYKYWPSDYRLISRAVNCYKMPADSLEALGEPKESGVLGQGASNSGDPVFSWEKNVKGNNFWSVYHELTIVVDKDTQLVSMIKASSTPAVGYRGENSNLVLPIRYVTKALELPDIPGEAYYTIPNRDDYRIFAVYKLKNGDIVDVGGWYYPGKPIEKVTKTNFKSGEMAVSYQKVKDFSWENVRVSYIYIGPPNTKLHPDHTGGELLFGGKVKIDP